MKKWERKYYTVKEEKMTREKICPKCGSSDISMIHYGFNEIPTEQERKKKIRLGRCAISQDSTKWVCDDCFYRWENSS